MGLSFKPGTDDIREAPSLINIAYLTENGAKIKVWDPIASNNFKRSFSGNLEYCNTIEDAISDVSACLILTEWEQIKKFDITKYAALMKNPIILDGRNCYKLERFKGLPVIYDSIGRKVIKNI